MKYFVWALLLPFNWLLTIIFWIFNPFAALFVIYKDTTLQVKRLDYQVVTLKRARLVWWLSWFDTFDNPTDEFWFGLYGPVNKDTQAQYDGSKLLRYTYRLKWLYRNTAYGFLNQFGIKKSNSLAFNIKKRIALPFGYCNDINIGWKAHSGFDKLMYAGRILGLRKIL